VPIPARKGASKPKWVCRYYEAKAVQGEGADPLPTPGPVATKLEDGQYYLFMCRDAATNQDVRLKEPLGFDVVRWQTGANIAGPLLANPGIDLARQVANTTISPRVPDVAFSPKGDQLIGLPTWFWARDHDALVTDQASAGGVVAQIEATALPDDGLEIDPGIDPADPRTYERCDIDSPAWERRARDNDPAACTYTYQHLPRNGPITARARIVYTARWWSDELDIEGDFGRLIYSPWFEIPLTFKGTQAVGR
jgi:hypothetical protein